MNVMKGLIIKDLENIKSYRTTVMFLVILMGISSFMNNNIQTYIPMFITFCAGMVAISSFNYDNIAKSDKYLRAFPVTKKDIVKARYLYVSLLTTMGTMLGIILAVVLQGIKGITLADINTIISSSLGALIGITTLQMIQLPIIYKFGVEKGMVIQMVVILILVLSLSAIAGFVVGRFSISVEEVLLIMQQYGFFIIGLLVILGYLASYNISYKIYLKNE